jgi:RecB family exonuclease
MKAFSRTAPVHPEDAGRDSRIDAFVERYVDWREECEALDSAYRRWARATASERDLAFAAYRATLDREEQSARAYELAAAPLEGSERE